MRVLNMFAAAILLLATGCVATETEPASVSHDVQEQYRSIDDAVQELADAADNSDVDYFSPLVWELDEHSARAMMEAVVKFDVRETYTEHMQSHIPATATEANLDYHGLGHFQIDLVRNEDGWVVESMWP